MNRIAHFLILGLLTVVLMFPPLLTDKTDRVSATCPQEVYDFCWSQGRLVDKTICDCKFDSCLNALPSDCQEQGGNFDYISCTCSMPPQEEGLCDRDPYALGCPRNPDSGEAAGMCTFASYSWCNHSGGQWSSYECTCNFQTTIGCTAGTGTADSCTAAGGTWDSSNCVCRKLPRENL